MNSKNQQFKKGQEEYSSMRDQYIRSGQGFLLVFSVASKDSILELDTFRELILRVKDKSKKKNFKIKNLS